MRIREKPSISRDELTQEIVREFFDYDPKTGVLLWKWRARRWFKYENNWQAWNTKYAGTQVASVAPATSYYVCGILGNICYVHRVIFLWMEGRWPEPTVDHINRNRQDNRWINLREATWEKQCDNRPQAKLTVEQALRIRVSKASDKLLAGRYRVSIAMVRGIRNGKFWKRPERHLLSDVNEPDQPLEENF